MGAGFHGGFGGTKGTVNNIGHMPSHGNTVTPKEIITEHFLDYTNPNERGKAEAYEKGSQCRDLFQIIWRRKNTIKENDRVRTLVEKEGFPVGTIGVVVSVYSSILACEVELWDENQYPVDVVTFLMEELEVIERKIVIEK